MNEFVPLAKLPIAHATTIRDPGNRKLLLGIQINESLRDKDLLLTRATGMHKVLTGKDFFPQVRRVSDLKDGRWILKQKLMALGTVDMISKQRLTPFIGSLIITSKNSKENSPIKGSRSQSMLH